MRSITIVKGKPPGSEQLLWRFGSKCPSCQPYEQSRRLRANLDTIGSDLSQYDQLLSIDLRTSCCVEEFTKQRAMRKDAEVEEARGQHNAQVAHGEVC